MSLKKEILKTRTVEQIELLAIILNAGYFDFCLKRRNAEIAIDYLTDHPVHAIAAQYRVSPSGVSGIFRNAYNRVFRKFFGFYLEFLTAYNLDWPEELKHKKLDRIAHEAYDYNVDLLKYKEYNLHSPYENFKAQFPQDCTRLFNHLYGMGVRNLYEMSNYTKEHLTKHCGFGPATYAQLMKVLDRKGIKLKEESANIQKGMN